MIDETNNITNPRAPMRGDKRVPYESTNNSTDERVGFSCSETETVFCRDERKDFVSRLVGGSPTRVKS